MTNQLFFESLIDNARNDKELAYINHNLEIHYSKRIK